MNNYESNGIEQLELLSVNESNEKRVPAKRVDIVSLRLNSVCPLALHRIQYKQYFVFFTTLV